MNLLCSMHMIACRMIYKYATPSIKMARVIGLTSYSCIDQKHIPTCNRIYDHNPVFENKM